jgi:endonuclease III
MEGAAPPHDRLRSRNERVHKQAPLRFSELSGVAAEDHDRWLARWLSDHLPRAAPDLTAASLLEITQRLSNVHGTPDLGNKADPVDELVYIILSRRTREGAYQLAYEALRSAFPRWEALAAAPPEEIEAIIAFSGLGRRKANSLKSALSALIARFGSCTLAPTRAWSDEAVADFLCSVPEVGPKSAACVMMCALDRPAFPVDAHVGRVFERLGAFQTLGLELAGTDHKVKQRVLWDAVPPSLRYPLHVNMVMHGRTTCLPRKPRCQECVLAKHCTYRQEAARRTGRSGRTGR